MQDISSRETSGHVGWVRVVGGEMVWSYLSPLSIKGKQCDRADPAGECQSDPFTMKEEMG